MKDTKDIRWIQRFKNYNKTLRTLKDAVKLNQERPLSKLEKQGLIQSFEYTHELAWKVMQDFFLFQGNSEKRGSRDATREAFKNELIVNGDKWMEMIKKRNLTSHTYNEETAEEISKSIIVDFYTLFIAFQNKMQKLVIKEENQ